MNTKVQSANKILNRFDVEKIRKDFPILGQTVHGKALCYFDNAATTQKPKAVIDTLNNYYLSMNSNVHRGIHYLSELATKQYDAARVKIQNFINAKSEKEVIFTRGTTESINLVAATFGRNNISEGDEIIKNLVNYVIEIPATEEIFSPLLAIIPLQKLAYHMAILRGCNVDQPRNLAKSVTVE